VGLRKAATALLATLALTACASTEQQIAAAAKIETTDDQFQPFRQYKSGAVAHTLVDVGTYRRVKMEMIAQVDRASGGRGIGLQVEIDYLASIQRKYLEARTSSAVLLHVSGVLHRSQGCSKKVGRCDHTEIVTIDIPEKELRQTGSDGYRLKLFPKIGQGVELNVPKSLIVALFTAVDAGEQKVAMAQKKP
jgi:hypothetical protein